MIADGFAVLLALLAHATRWSLARRASGVSVSLALFLRSRAAAEERLPRRTRFLPLALVDGPAPVYASCVRRRSLAASSRISSMSTSAAAFSASDSERALSRAAAFAALLSFSIVTIVLRSFSSRNSLVMRMMITSAMTMTRRMRDEKVTSPTRPRIIIGSASIFLHTSKPEAFLAATTSTSEHRAKSHFWERAFK